MREYRTKAVITQDRRIEFVVPQDLPPGEAEVVVRVSGRPAATHGGSLEVFLEELSNSDRPLRPRDEVEAEIQALRDDWD
jgi:hypothetical protein